MRRAGGGSIINTGTTALAFLAPSSYLWQLTGETRTSCAVAASFVAKLGAATPQIAYTASKGAVLAMTYVLVPTRLIHTPSPAPARPNWEPCLCLLPQA